MTHQLVQVPVDLLCSPVLSATAKLIWMAAALRPPGDPGGISGLSALAGLARPTVRKGLAELEAAGWRPDRRPDPGPAIPFPASLVTDHRLGFRARLLYGFLHLTPGFSHGMGASALAELADLARVDPKTASRALQELVRAEWITLERANRLDRIHFALTYPGRARGLEALAAAERRLGRGGFHGEALMREFLTLLVDSEEFEDDAAPGFLVNPRTQERLQFDRFYPPKVAFEYNGPQHYRETRRFTAEQVAAQRERDLIKRGICSERGIALVIIHSEDLTLQGMRAHVGELLPARDLTGYELLIGYLEEEGQGYMRRMAHI